jgi:alkylation response protein AidB-like acyl-CoA dehydrogenase
MLGADRVGWVLASDVDVEAAPSMDPTRRLGRVRLGGRTGMALDADAGRLRLLGTVLAAAEASGVAERTLEMSVEYGKVREQFGKPIGTFQAIKHRCADMAVRAEVARSVVTYAAVVLQEGGQEADADARHHVHIAKILATEAALQNATDNVQNHGGMGYTWESDAHLFLKRARVLEHCFGSRTDHLDALSAPWRAAS